MRCALNPQAGYEAEVERLKPIARSKKVVIVGGGICGMQAAITAKRKRPSTNYFRKERFFKRSVESRQCSAA
jgi:NADPH-dependent 2,4-dienoyl-CoA reductase/sulfur reductase-like enzyme